MRHPFLFTALIFLFFSCDNTTVPKTDYDALEAYTKELEAENDSLQFELSCLKDYVEYLEEENTELVEELKRTPVE